MTNTLHRQGTVESLGRDFVIFAHAAAGYNKEGCAPKLKSFLNICLRHQPVNIGTGDFEPRWANFLVEWLRDRRTGGHEQPAAQRRRWEQMIQKINDDSGAYAVFYDPATLAAVVADLKEADLGLSICISGLHDKVDELLRGVGIIRHSVEHSLGFHGDTQRLPHRAVLEISTMCGHGMVSFNLAKKMLDAVKMGQMTPELAGRYLAKPCTCGVFNPARAAALLRGYRGKV